MLSSRPYFVAGGTLSGSAPSYVERRADAELLSALLAGEYCYVLDTRQVGKSSLIVRAARRLAEAGCRATFLDLSTFGVAATEEQWYGKLLADLVRAVGLEDEADAFWEANARYSGAQRWFLAMRDLVLPSLRAPLVVFVDEIEAVQKQDLPTDGFFAMVRALHNLRATEPAAERLTFCLAGVATPAELIRDHRTTPFNVGRRVALRDFTPAEMLQLARGLHGTPAQREAQIRRIGGWTSGHPYLTQRLCRAASEAGRALGAREIDRLCREVFLHGRAHAEEANLHFVRRQVLGDEAPDDLLSLYGRVLSGRRVGAGTADALADRLLLCGLVRIAAGSEPPRLEVRNPVYARVFGRAWVRASLSGAEARRQRQAVRQGYLRASLVWCIVGASLLFALARQHQVDWQRGELSRTERALDAAAVELGRKQDKIRQADADRRTLGEEMKGQQSSIARLTEAAGKLEADRKAKLALLDRTQRAQRQADEALRSARSESKAVREESEAKRQAALALMGSVVSGQEFEALAHGLDAVTPALGRHEAPPAEGAQALAHAVTAGAYRLFSLRQGCRLNTASFSPDGRWIVTAGRSRDAFLWDARTGKLLRALPVLPASVLEPTVWAAEFSGDGRYLVTAGIDQQARVWDTGTLAGGEPRCVWTVPCGGPAKTATLARFSPSGRYLAVSGVSGGSYAATVWDFAARRQVAKLRFECVIGSLDFNNKPDRDASRERYVVLAGAPSPYVRIFDFLAGREGKEAYAYAQPGNGAVWQAQFACWNDSVYSGGSAGATTAWDWPGRPGGEAASAGAYRTYSGHEGGVASLAVASDGCLLASAGSGDHLVRVWYREFSSWPLYTLSTHAAAVTSVRFSGDSHRLLTASYDGTAEVWLLPAPVYCGSGSRLNFLALSPDGSAAAAPAGDAAGTGRVLLWNLRPSPLSNTNAGRWPKHILGQQGDYPFPGIVLDAEYSPDRKHLATCGAHGSVRIWELPARNQGTKPPLELQRFSDANVNCVAYSPDGRLIISASDDQTLRFWDTSSGRPTGTPIPHPHKVQSCAFSPDGRLVLTGCTDGNARIYDLNGRLLRQFHPGGPRGWAVPTYPFSVAFSPDGRTLLTGDTDGNAYLWEGSTGRRVATLPFRHGQVFSAQFSRDGKRVLTVGEGGYAEVWNVAEALAAERRGALPLPWFSIRSGMAALFGGQFSADGQYIFVAGQDCTVRRYPVALEACVQEAQRIRRLGGSLPSKSPAPPPVPPR